MVRVLKKMKKLTQWAREHRKNPTPAEKALKKLLLLWHIKFRTQRMIERYIVDFLIPDRWLVVELDGGYHATRKSEDAKRDAFLRSQGFTVLHFENETVFNDPFSILDLILYVPMRPPPSNPLKLYGKANY